MQMKANQIRNTFSYRKYAASDTLWIRISVNVREEIGRHHFDHTQYEFLYANFESL